MNKSSLYADKISSYQSNSTMFLGRLVEFKDYYEEFGKLQKGHGVDIGAGPQGPYFNFYPDCSQLDACDAEKQVVESLPSSYSSRFLFKLGKQSLPYETNSLDFAACSCVIQHLDSWEEVSKALEDIHRVLKVGGQFLLIYKCGNHDSVFTHYNPHYGYERTFRVFHPEIVKEKLTQTGFVVTKEDKGVDHLFVCYHFLTLEKSSH